MNTFLGCFCSRVIFFLHKFNQNRQGITSIEYGLIGTAIAVFVVSVLYGDYTFVEKLKEKLLFLADLISNTILMFN
ncbi:Flp family type IVb pilin [Aggregatibacter actinomycetemcomitans]|uniref:Flp family type IVb pilin n=1 Tax=Aggregatibacter actinomycetemcomitans TaxID=714 RepID=UPI001F120CCE|nr:Flp family type IVb pilin [Aggregatibacter actinomycetemcomitans]